MPFTELYHVGAREYDPRTARWLQRDPIDASSGDPNLYRYAGNDPLNFTDVDGADKEEKQPNQSASKKAAEKTQEKVAFICVGDTTAAWFSWFFVERGVDRTVALVAADLELAGYKVKIDEDCTAEELLNALKDPNIAAFVFVGHSASDPETNSFALMATDAGIAPAEIEDALGGRRLERVELHACNTDNNVWRNAFNNPERFHGKTGLYHPVLRVDWGKLLGNRHKKEVKKERRRNTKQHPFTRKRTK
ncbi:MAG: hypothetical protein KatS3mg054_1073 [Chloroflexus sp.]|nr:MAG: hypothetical protein KatS3mg054_1073 [Chloroflexus sp.]